MEVERRAGGKLFHARGPATANARSPMDARRVDGTTKSEVDAVIIHGNNIMREKNILSTMLSTKWW